MFSPLWHGFPLTRADRVNFARTQRSWRQFALMQQTQGGYWTYVAVSPCGRVAKVGRSRNPVARVHFNSGLLKAERRLGIDHPYIVRAYYGGKELEPECLAFLAPDRIEGEWFKVGPRLRILVSRLDREFRREQQRRRARRLRKASAPQVVKNAA